MNPDDWTPEEEAAWNDKQAQHRAQEAAAMDMLRQANQRIINSLRKASDKQVAGTHYKDMGVEPWDVVDTWPLQQRIGAYRHGALKYLMRMGSKDEQAQEIKKAIHYLEKLVEVLEDNNGA